MKKTKLNENDCGVIYRFDKIPNSMFNFYIIKRRTFKDGTHSWNLCVEYASNPSKFMVLQSGFRGKRADAIKRLEELIKNG